MGRKVVWHDQGELRRHLGPHHAQGARPAVARQRMLGRAHNNATEVARILRQMRTMKALERRTCRLERANHEWVASLVADNCEDRCRFLLASGRGGASDDSEDNVPVTPE